MCGIFSIFNNNQIISDTIIKKSFDKGKNRGPEKSEFKIINDNLLFGFHRLAINGLDDGSSQPITIDNITLICNGEIYNYKELYTFMDIIPSTNSDCEIIIHLYKKYGIDYLLQLLDGVFAFIIYDSDLQKIFVARDPYGVRPLYIMNQINKNNHNENSNIIPTAFASELKVLHVLMDDLYNNEAINEFDKQNLKISHVLPGTYMTFYKKNIANPTNDWLSLSETKYNIYKFSDNSLLSLKEAYGSITNVYYNICSKLINAVKKRIIGTTDRPIACLLSGGLDSSIIAAIVSKIYPGKLETYSIGMHGSEDLRFAEIVAEHIGSKHTNIKVKEEDFFKAIPVVVEAIESYDTTTVRASVGNYLIGKYIAENSNAKVIFNGDGSDELTGGYLYFHSVPNNLEFDKECKRLLSNIYAFDVLRSDKCISSHGLEPRTPFLDRAWVDYYLSIPLYLRRPSAEQIEKHLLRSAFAKFEPNLLPDCVLWRKKEAFSDGVSGKDKTWFEIIHEKIELLPSPITPKNNYYVNEPKTKEQLYYRTIYDEAYPNTSSIVPYFWMPQYTEATDPSARTLNNYKK